MSFCKTKTNKSFINDDAKFNGYELDGLTDLDASLFRDVIPAITVTHSCVGVGTIFTRILLSNVGNTDSWNAIATWCYWKVSKWVYQADRFFLILTKYNIHNATHFKFPIFFTFITMKNLSMLKGRCFMRHAARAAAPASHGSCREVWCNTREICLDLLTGQGFPTVHSFNLSTIFVPNVLLLPW